MEKIKKITKKDFYKKIITIAEERQDEELKNFAIHEIELIENKANKKTTKTNEKNENIKNKIIQALLDLARPVTITELLNANEELKTLTEGSNQKTSALMTQLKDANKVKREEIKGRAYFSSID